MTVIDGVCEGVRSGETVMRVINHPVAFPFKRAVMRLGGNGEKNFETFGIVSLK
jgi:hypothetical protein